eukprot:3643688-Rhodomonas_salina.1
MGVHSVSCPVTCVVVKTPGLARRVVHAVYNTGGGGREGNQEGGGGGREEGGGDLKKEEAEEATANGLCASAMSRDLCHGSALCVLSRDLCC